MIVSNGPNFSSAWYVKNSKNASGRLLPRPLDAHRKPVFRKSVSTKRSFEKAFAFSPPKRMWRVPFSGRNRPEFSRKSEPTEEKRSVQAVLIDFFRLPTEIRNDCLPEMLDREVYIQVPESHRTEFPRCSWNPLKPARHLSGDMYSL